MRQPRKGSIRLLVALIRDFPLPLSESAHKPAGRVEPTKDNNGHTFACSCGYVALTQRGLSHHTSIRNRRK